MNEHHAAVESVLMEKLLDDSLSLEAEKAAVEAVLRSKPTLALPLLLTTIGQKHQSRTAEQETRRAYANLAKTLDEPPWHPGQFLGLTGDAQRALVTVGGRRALVTLGPGVDPATLSRGAPIYLNAMQNVLLGPAPDLPRPGSIAEYSRAHGSAQAVLRGPADEEIVVDVSADLLDTQLARGDLVLYDRESQIAYRRVEDRHQQASLLDDLPLDLRREDLGGLDAVFDELVAEATLQLLRPDLVRRYRLRPVRGVLLCGPPGTGKTSLVKALGHHLGEATGAAVKVLLVRPGVHRSMWFGASEQRIRDLFREARSAAEHAGQYVLLFFDDMDHLGSRDHRAAGEVDARLLPCFLQEIDALGTERLLLVGATNREDLVDEALLRPGRFGRLFRIGRPDRRQAREIFRRHFTPDLPAHENGHHGEEAVHAIIEDLVASLYSPNGHLARLATLTLRDGSRQPLTAAQVMSGALIADAVEQAKRRGCYRVLDGGPAELEADDLRSAVTRELASICDRLRPGPSLHHLLNLPPDVDVVRVEPCALQPDVDAIAG